MSTTIDVLLNYTPSTLVNYGKYYQFRNVQKTKHGKKFNLFEKVYQQNVELNNLLENVTMRLDTHEKKLNDILRNQETNQVNNPNNVTEIKDNQTQPIQIRSFRPHLLNPENENLNIGSSIISRINQNDLPRDVAIHAYPGSTTDEKAGILDSYKNKQLRTITLQDGTYTLLKQRSINVKNHFEKQKLLVEKLSSKFRPQKIFICQIPPVKIDDTVNERIRNFNNLLNNEYHDNPAIEIISLHERLCAVNNSSNPFFDNIHFNYKFGLPSIKFSLLSHILKYSNNVPREQLVQKRNNYWNYPRSYNYQRNFN